MAEVGRRAAAAAAAAGVEASTAAAALPIAPPPPRRRAAARPPPPSAAFLPSLPPALLLLPADLLLLVLRLLPAAALAHAARTCRRLLALAHAAAAPLLAASPTAPRRGESLLSAYAFASAFASLPPPTLCAGQYHALWVVGAKLHASGGHAGSTHLLGLADGRRHAAFAPPAAASPLHRLQVTQVAAGARHALCLAASGEVWTFGHNDLGQLGRADADASREWPPAVAWRGGGGGGARLVAAGAFCSLLATRRGALLGFGSNAYGELRAAAPAVLRAAAPLCRRRALAAAAGRAHVVWLSPRGEAFARGRDTHAQCAGGGGRVALPARGVRVACGNNHSVALLEDGRVFAWGCDEAGQCGGGGGRVAAALRVGGVAVGVAAGYAHTLVLVEEEGGGGERWVVSLGWAKQGQCALRVRRRGLRQVAAGGCASFVEVEGEGGAPPRLLSCGGGAELCYAQCGQGEPRGGGWVCPPGWARREEQ